MHTSRLLPSWLNALVVISLLLIFVPAPAQAAPRPAAHSVSLDTDETLPEDEQVTLRSPLEDAPLVTARESDLAALPAWWLIATEENGARGRLLSPLELEDEVYYLGDTAYSVHLVSHEDDKDWGKGAFCAGEAEADVVAVVFRVSKSGACSLKRMRNNAFCPDSKALWPDTSGSLQDGIYYCSGNDGAGKEACEAIAPEATRLRFGNTRLAGEVVHGGFQLGYKKDCAASVYDIRLIYRDVITSSSGEDGWGDCECPFGCSSDRQNSVGGPINTRTGNYHYDRQDISIPALGGPLYFERSYNAQAVGVYTTTLGPGWTHNYDVSLTFPDDPGGEEDMVIVKGCRGSRFRFEDNGDGTYNPFPGVWATLTRTLETTPTYVLKGVDQSTYVFTSMGLLTEIRDPQDHAVTFVYSGTQLMQVKDDIGGRYLDLEYDDGLLVKVRDPISRTIQLGYSGGDLTVVTDTLGQAWTYTYTGTHLLRDVRDPNDHVVERTEYDGQGRAVRQWSGFEVGETPGDPLSIYYNPGAYGATTITDPLGRVTVDSYASDGTLVYQSNAAGLSSRTYDDNLNWTSTTDANGHTTRYEFSTIGLPQVITDALDNVYHVAYDDLNHLAAITDALTRTTRYEYAGNLLITTTDAMSGTVVNTYRDRLLIQTVDHGITTTYGHDEFGQRTAITDAMGLVTRYEYDAVGRLITTTAPTGLVTVNEHDDGDNLVRVTRNYTTAGGQNYPPLSGGEWGGLQPGDSVRLRRCRKPGGDDRHRAIPGIA
jgi:YD repeat-containing protein